MGSESIEAVLDRFFAAIEGGDRATIDELYADDVAVWHSATDRTVGKADALAILDWFMAPGSARRYQVVEQLILGDRVARRHVLTVELPGHDPIVMPVALFLTVADGRIRTIEEYVDAKGTDQLIALIPVPSA